MRYMVMALLALASSQSPLHDALRDAEAKRREFFLREEAAIRQEEVGAKPVAIAFRPGRPLAWVSVVRTIDEAVHCGVPGDAFVFTLDQQILYRCAPDGSRTPFAVDYSVILTVGPTTIVEWTAGKKEEHRLR